MIRIEEILRAGDSVNIRTTGRSMRPTFRDGKDYVTLVPTDGNDLEVGDVVFFDRGDQFCLHRIIRINGDKLTIRGDGNQPSALERVRRSAVVGKVSSGTMRGGRSFKVSDPEWKANTARVLKHYPLIALWHRLWDVLKHYPLSILITGVVLYLSFMNTSTITIKTFEGADKFVHVAMYLGISLVFWLEWMRVHRLMRRSDIAKGFFFCLLVPIIFGGLIELGQEYFTGGMRSGDILDFAADIAGTIAATMISFAVTFPLLGRRS